MSQFERRTRQTKVSNPILGLAVCLPACLALAAAPAARAQRPAELPQPAVPQPDISELLTNKGIEKRLERDEKALRDLREIVLKAKALGAPVEVKDAGPDPEVQALETRVNDLEETLRRQTGQLEVMTHDADLAAKAASDAKAANAALAARLDDAEKQIMALSAPPAQAAAPAAGAAAGPPPAGFGGAPPASARALDQPAPPEGPDSELASYRAARQTLDSGDYAGGAAALQDYLQRYPMSPRAPEANYWLGRTLALRNMHADAAAAYARALRGWPGTAWAADAVIRLAASLIQLNRTSDACRAIEEFQARYAAKSLPTVRARARETRAAAACA